MKLYTEEQVNELCRALRDIAQWDEFLEDDWEDAGYRAMDALRSFKKITPIELLNFDKLWDEFRVEHPNTVGVFKEQYECFKWMKEQILNQNKV